MGNKMFPNHNLPLLIILVDISGGRYYNILKDG